MAFRDQSKLAALASSIKSRTAFARADIRPAAYSVLSIENWSTSVEVKSSKFSCRLARCPASFKSRITWYIFSAWALETSVGSTGWDFSGVVVSFSCSGVLSRTSFSSLSCSYVSYLVSYGPKNMNCKVHTGNVSQRCA